MAKRQQRTFDMKPAVREAMPVYLGVAGPSSSGKTYSALRLALGIQRVSGGDIGVIDTENRRALLYADFFKFHHIPFGAPFNALSYLDAFRFAKSKGVKILIVDSMSHEHEGDGGHLAMHEAELDRMAGDNWERRAQLNMLAWAKPAAERRALLLELQQLPMHRILCFRAKDKVAPMKNDKGKTEFVSIGWQPIAGSEYVFDMNALAVLPPNSGGVPDWTAEASKISRGLDVLFQKGKPLDEDTGERLARYMAGDKTVKAEGATASRPPARQTPQADDEGLDDAPSTDAPLFVPKGGWPTFEKRSQWAAYAKTFLKTANAGQAQAWRLHYHDDDQFLTDKANDGSAPHQKARGEIDALLKDAAERK